MHKTVCTNRLLYLPPFIPHPPSLSPPPSLPFYHPFLDPPPVRISLLSWESTPFLASSICPGIEHRFDGLMIIDSGGILVYPSWAMQEGTVQWFRAIY